MLDLGHRRSEVDEEGHGGHVTKEAAVAQQLEAVVIAQPLDSLEFENAHDTGVSHEIKVELAPTHRMPLIHDRHAAPAGEEVHLDGEVKLHLEGRVVNGFRVTGTKG